MAQQILEPVERCRYAIQKRSARCRNKWPCPILAHREGRAPIAPRPDIIIVHVNLNHHWDGLFEKEGIVLHVVEEEAAWERHDEHVERAFNLSRDPYAIRKELGWELDLPESADAGALSLIISDGDVVELFREIKGYSLTWFERLHREWKNVKRCLSLELTRLIRISEIDASETITGKKSVGKEFPFQLFSRFVKTCFGTVEVFTNERNEKGFVLHSLKCYGRKDDVAPRYRIRFKNGLWGFEPL